MELNKKIKILQKVIQDYGSAVIAFSGGVDSSFLAKVVYEVLKDRCLAVTAISPTIPEREIFQARKVAEEIGIPLEFIHSNELANEKFIHNSPERCYYCKHEIFGKIKELAQSRGYSYVLDGSNFDDLKDYRPGMRALAQLGIQSPLKEAQLTKEEIRVLSKSMGLSTWDKPSYACLASRFPYGQTITKEKLAMVEQAENFLQDLGFRQLRVRHHDNLARIELEKSFLGEAMEKAELIVQKFKEIGYTYVALDLEGYRTGSMNLAIKAEEKSYGS